MPCCCRGNLLAVEFWIRPARDHRELEHDVENRPRYSRALFRVLLGNRPAQVVDVPAHAPAVGQFSGGLPPEQQVFRSTGGVRLTQGQPARGPLSSRLRRAHGPAWQAHRPWIPAAVAPIHTARAGRPTLKSLAGVDRALMRASVVEVNKLEKHIGFLATTAADYAVHRTLRHRRRHHDRVSGHRADRAPPASPSSRRRLPTRWSRRPAASWRRFRRSIYYNLLTHHVKIFASEMDDFAMEFLNIAERNFT